MLRGSNALYRHAPQSKLEWVDSRSRCLRQLTKVLLDFPKGLLRSYQVEASSSKPNDQVTSACAHHGRNEDIGVDCPCVNDHDACALSAT